MKRERMKEEMKETTTTATATSDKKDIRKRFRPDV